MSQLPNANSAILAVVSLFRAPEWQHSIRKRFVNSDMRLDSLSSHTMELLDLLRQALGFEPSSELWADICNKVLSFANALDAIAIHTRTFKATPQQSLWISLGYDVAPVLGRSWGFWCQDESVLPSQPGGDLWFLPRINPNNPERLILPVETLADWWANQIEGPLEKIWPNAADDRLRSFGNWKSGRTTPVPSKIEEWFNDDTQFAYKGPVATPMTTLQVRSLFLWARALEQSYKDLVRYFTPDVDPHDVDPKRNKTLQLVELFRWSHQCTMATDPQNPALAAQAFADALPSSAKNGPFFAITPNSAGELPPAERVADFLTGIFIGLRCDCALPDIFEDLGMRVPARLALDDALRDQRAAVEQGIKGATAIWRSSTSDGQYEVAVAITKLKKMPRHNEFEPDIAYIQALNALSAGNFDHAREHIDLALDLCKRASIGPMMLAIAKLSFALSVAQDAFKQSRAERSFRILCKSVQPEDADRWKLGEADIGYSMRLAAADHAAWFWGEMIRPYVGVIVERPLEEKSEIFEAYAALLFRGASETEIKDFLRKFRPILKLKLRDIRGDTFFTVMSKMVSHIAKTMRDMPTYPSIPKEPSDLANAMTKTHLLLTSLLPTDVLNARDYLDQTALMLAADRKDSNMVKELLERHVDLDAQDALGRTALHSAAKVGADRCFKLLLEKGADPTLKTTGGKTPAIFAAEFGRATIFEMRLNCATYPMAPEELEEAHALAQDSAANFKAKRKSYAIQGYEIAGRMEFEKIGVLSSGRAER